MKITFLGTGTSNAVPQIDCMLNNYSRCPHSFCANSGEDPRHVRTRSSILIEKKDTAIIIDTSMDFRFQVMRAKVLKIDAVLYTHSHADHIYGLPDIRAYSFKQKKAIDIFGSDETIEYIKKSFSYIFNSPAIIGGGKPELSLNKIFGKFSVGDLSVTPVPVEHGLLKECLGYRIDNVAYIPDVKSIPQTSIILLNDLDLLIVDALRRNPHSTHLSLDESINLALALKPKKTLFTHLCHDIHYKEEEKRLPENIRFAYDTLQIELPD